MRRVILGFGSALLLALASFGTVAAQDGPPQGEVPPMTQCAEFIVPVALDTGWGTLGGVRTGCAGVVLLP